jgi:hypothetical protein
MLHTQQTDISTHRKILICLFKKRKKPSSKFIGITKISAHSLTHYSSESPRPPEIGSEFLITSCPYKSQNIKKFIFIFTKETC